MNFDPSVELETKRLILRFMREEDTHDIFRNINHDKDVLKFYMDKYVEDEKDMTLNKTIEYCLNNQKYFFAIELKENHEVIGMIHQCSTPNERFNSTEIGYAIGQKYWNQGYVTEALKAMIKFMLSLGIHKVEVSYLVGNDASRRVIEKNGLVFEGRRKDEVFYRGQYHDVDYYYIINEDK